MHSTNLEINELPILDDEGMILCINYMTCL